MKYQEHEIELLNDVILDHYFLLDKMEISEDAIDDLMEDYVLGRDLNEIYPIKISSKEFIELSNFIFKKSDYPLVAKKATFSGDVKFSLKPMYRFSVKNWDQLRYFESDLFDEETQLFELIYYIHREAREVLNELGWLDGEDK